MPGIDTATKSTDALRSDLLHLLSQRRRLDTSSLPSQIDKDASAGQCLKRLAEELTLQGWTAEADSIKTVYDLVVDSPNFGGLGVGKETHLSRDQYDEVLFLVDSWLEALNSAERVPVALEPTSERSQEVRPMTLAQKIFAQHVVGGCPAAGLQVGDVVRISVDWILASELSWNMMHNVYQELGAPGIWRNDRFWLAGDHIVHPDVLQRPNVRNIIEKANLAKKNFAMTEYQGMNYTIMHSEFVRERAEPGMLCIGSDSHTCSAGAVGCLSIGLGVADTQMALSVGETWFKVPESILIELKGKPSFGVTGKDIILFILKELKRNTVAAERIVEFVGDGLQYLSVDARFSISNMCTEFGAITGVFQPDHVVKDYISHRRRKRYQRQSLYFEADPDASYASKHTINLEDIEPYIAVYPEPDHIVPLSEKADLKFDGVFIGACTTTEEELVLGALVLRAGLRKGLKSAPGKRRYVPGSLPIVEKLRELNLLEIYEKAGFTRGPPGCSFCVGISADHANAGETWLSSQNRNFKNRMGAGAFGHVTTAMVCAATSFSMQLTDPRPFLNSDDIEFFRKYRGDVGQIHNSPTYVQPGVRPNPANQKITSSKSGSDKKTQSHDIKPIHSKVITIGDFVDTDALSPGDTLATCTTDEDFGKHVLKHTYPEFREKVRGGQQVVVAGQALGVGSSRESAVQALKGVGVKAVIGRSFAFIYSRNQPSLGLPGIVMTDEAFYERAKDEVDISIDFDARTIEVDGTRFDFQLSDIEYALIANKGVAATFRMYGKDLWKKMTCSESSESEMEQIQAAETNKALDW